MSGPSQASGSLLTTSSPAGIAPDLAESALINGGNLVSLFGRCYARHVFVGAYRSCGVFPEYVGGGDGE